MQTFIWAEPRNVTSIDDCYFYHTMDIPGHGVVHGPWDLRGREAAYLGNVSLAGKRVLVGTASGHLCFAMEKMGASVVSYDLSDEQSWDVVPYAGFDTKQFMAERKAHIRQLNNGYWFAHRAFNSSAKVVYGSVYEIPDNIGTFDACTFGSILLHLRDPFLALQRASAHVQETIIVTDVFNTLGLRQHAYNMWLAMAEAVSGSGVKLIRFLPNAKSRAPLDTWWILTPRLVSEFLQILGFECTTISFHRQLSENRECKLFTVVGQRKKVGTS
jgi:hypothetical protein